MAALLGIIPSAVAQPVVEGVSVDGFRMEHNGRYMSVDMVLDLSALEVDGNSAVLLTPRLVSGTDSLDLPSIGIYGRRRYYFYERNSANMLSGKDEASYMASRRPDSFSYSKVLTYEDWMDGSSLYLHRSEWGCCNTLMDEQEGLLGRHAEAFFPVLVYVCPEAERVKSRSIEGSAYIDFPVDKTEIYPDYRRNSVELGKIRGTIDSVRTDSDVTITSVWLKGYASPESPYSHNRDLAIGRTDALKTYIRQLYNFAEDRIITGYEPEDWEGLRRYVEQTNLEHRTEILGLIDADLDPDVKEWKIKSAYPEDYRFLLDNCYPALRHTDYRIAYDVRSYSEASEIGRVMRTHPQNLSLNEFYLLAQEYEPGSDEFAEVFETAVRMYPADETANLNAANAAMRRGDNAGAARYLDKAGDSAEAVYARAALAIRVEDYDTARKYLDEAASLGLEQAAITLERLEQRIH